MHEIFGFRRNQFSLYFMLRPNLCDVVMCVCLHERTVQQKLEHGYVAYDRWFYEVLMPFFFLPEVNLQTFKNRQPQNVLLYYFDTVSMAVCKEDCELGAFDRFGGF